MGLPSGLQRSERIGSAETVNAKIVPYPSPKADLRPSALDMPGLDLDFADHTRLAKAFEFFNQMSEQLTEAYTALQDQVETLTQELDQAEKRHEQDVADTARVTGRLEGLLNVLPVGVVVLDVRGMVQDCNPAAIDFLGEPLIGQRWLDVIQRCFAPRMDDGHEISLKDGRRVSLATRSLEVEPGQLVVLTDQTQTRTLQERLSRHERLSALGKMVASLAHQVRTPLAAAMLYGEHLGDTSLTADQQQRFANKLMSRLNNLDRQVRDMLVFAKGDLPLSDRLTTQTLVQDIRMAMEALLSSSGSRCECTNDAEGVLLQCNRDALSGAILNLINNAIQAVGREADMSLRLFVDAEDQLSICVSDHGPGIDQALCERVMEPFFSTKPQGTGLGLAVVQAVARAHQGRLSIASEQGQGTDITLTLPVATAAENEAVAL